MSHSEERCIPAGKAAATFGDLGHEFFVIEWGAQFSHSEFSLCETKPNSEIAGHAIRTDAACFLGILTLTLIMPTVSVQHNAIMFHDVSWLEERQHRSGYHQRLEWPKVCRSCGRHLLTGRSHQKELGRTYSLNVVQVSRKQDFLMKLHIPVVDKRKKKINRSCSVLTKAE